MVKMVAKAMTRPIMTIACCQEVAVLAVPVAAVPEQVLVPKAVMAVKAEVVLLH